MIFFRPAIVAWGGGGFLLSSLVCLSVRPSSSSLFSPPPLPLDDQKNFSLPAKATEDILCYNSVVCTRIYIYIYS